jgi:hypothetical protein
LGNFGSMENLLAVDGVMSGEMLAHWGRRQFHPTIDIIRALFIAEDP